MAEEVEAVEAVEYHVIQLVEGRLLVIQRKGVENSQVNQNLQMVNEMVHDPNAAQTLHISSLSSVSS